ncbi:MAG: hypothetical protein KKD38_04720 [Candidatus Delongbacteria bacterium]|nr:hypothetical protein [Candidatus Delongbacteria bacterium]MCG2761293.1 hypothetical protein [Candidatus Delongbacteria bacterium]
MKKTAVSLIILAVAMSLFAGLTDSGQIAARIASGTVLTVAAYPTNTTTGTPTPISDGTGCSGVVVVDDIIVNDNSAAGWTLTITQTNGNLLHETSAATIAYSLVIDLVSGALGTGLSLSHGDLGALTFVTKVETIEATGSSSSPTVDYLFDLQMTIADLDVVDPLAGNYVETLDFVLASND